MFRSMSKLTTAAVTALAIGGSVAVAQDMGPGPQRVRVGTLTCDISAGLGLIVASQKQVRCMYTPNQPGPREVYFGTISKVGLDVGGTAGGELVWAVYAPTTQRIAALEGRYTGPNAEATVGLGAGANFLLGGSDRTVALQPISVQGQAGLNLAVTIASLELHRAQ